MDRKNLQIQKVLGRLILIIIISNCIHEINECCQIVNIAYGSTELPRGRRKRRTHPQSTLHLLARRLYIILRKQPHPYNALIPLMPRETPLSLLSALMTSQKWEMKLQQKNYVLPQMLTRSRCKNMHIGERQTPKRASRKQKK